jgi:hypothetical protein
MGNFCGERLVFATYRLVFGPGSVVFMGNVTIKRNRRGEVARKPSVTELIGGETI